jgi:DNA helicase-2/ATP-dependent DNA helicase PcrA
LAGTKQGVAEKGDAIYTHYRALLRAKYYQDFPRREQDMDNFLALLGNFRSVDQLLTDLALDPVDHVARQKPEEKDEAPLVLSTIHSAKGLEWHSVFLIHALDGVIPSAYCLHDAKAVDEELRLLYVALTRARYGLYICYPTLMTRRNFETYLTNPSRFLKPVPQEAYETWALTSELPANALPAPSPPALNAGS